MSLSFTHNVASNLHSKSYIIYEEKNINSKDESTLKCVHWSLTAVTNNSLELLLCIQSCAVPLRLSQVQSGISTASRTSRFLWCSHRFTFKPELVIQKQQTTSSLRFSCKAFSPEILLQLFLFLSPESLKSNFISYFSPKSCLISLKSSCFIFHKVHPAPPTQPGFVQPAVSSEIWWFSPPLKILQELTSWYLTSNSHYHNLICIYGFELTYCTFKWLLPFSNRIYCSLTMSLTSMIYSCCFPIWESDSLCCLSEVNVQLMST